MNWNRVRFAGEKQKYNILTKTPNMENVLLLLVKNVEQMDGWCIKHLNIVQMIKQ